MSVLFQYKVPTVFDFKYFSLKMCLELSGWYQNSNLPDGSGVVTLIQIFCFLNYFIQDLPRLISCAHEEGNSRTIGCLFILEGQWEEILK